MSDPLDQARHTSDMLLQHSLAHREPEAPAACGHCLYCQTALKPPRRWCNADCRDDWQNDQKRGAS